MAINYSSPSLDFDVETEALLNALKNQRQDAAAVAPTVAARGFTPGAAPLGGVGAALTRAAGMMGEGRVMDERRALSAEELRRLNQLQAELATPGRKPGKSFRTYGNTDTANKYGTDRGSAQTQMLAEQDAGMPELRADQVFNTEKGSQQSVMLDDQYDAFAPKPTRVNDPTDFVEHTTTVPMTPMEENARRMDIASRMSRLPMARKQADQLWQKGIGFPETMAQLEAKQIDAREARAQREQLARDQMRATEEWRRSQLTADERARQDKLDAAARTQAEKADAKATAAAASLDQLDGTIASIDLAIGKRDAQGNLLEGEKPHSGMESAVGLGVPGLRLIPGSDTASYIPIHENVVASARLQGVAQMKGAGAVSNAEGEAAAKAIQAISLMSSEKDYIPAMLKYREVLTRARDRMARGVKVDPVTGQEYTPAAPAAAPGGAPAAPAAPPTAPAAPRPPAPRAAAAGQQITVVRNGKTFVKGADGSWYMDTGAR